MKAQVLFISMIFCSAVSIAQEQSQDRQASYKKRVLESTEVNFLSSYYKQEGNNSAVGGGIGTEELTNVTPTVVVSVPLNADDVLSVDVGISAYSSASSSNINPFDGRRGEASPFQASSGESQSDALTGLNVNYSHSSDDRNQLWSAHVAISKEYDYRSVGFGGSYTKLYNQKNTEFSIKGNVFMDKWQAIYPIELEAYVNGGAAGEMDYDDDYEYFDFNNYRITGNAVYRPLNFKPFDSETRNSYTLGLSLSQILSRNLQGMILMDFVAQNGLLSTPYQRVYFADVSNSYIENFHLADDVERLPGSRFKVALGGRLNYYLNERLTLRSYYRYYRDNWGLMAHTASVTMPIKITDAFTVYPTYRAYWQVQADYFAPYEQHVSTQNFYTSDFDLSQFNSRQYGFGVAYTDIFTKLSIWKAGLKEVNLSYNRYMRTTGLDAGIVSFAMKFVVE